jgi:AcrR family transcriptional regulator
MSARRLAPGERRAQLVEAALECFREQGVPATTVSDIVKRAGVAQGTFYLYFDTKDELLCSLVEYALDGLAERIEEAVAGDGTAVDKLLVLRDAFTELADEPHEQEALRVLHQPENRDLHDRVTAAFLPRLQPVMERILAQGIDEGAFDVADPGTAALFVLGTFSALESTLGGSGDPGRLIPEVTRYTLRGLGYAEDAGQV